MRKIIFLLIIGFLLMECKDAKPKTGDFCNLDSYEIAVGDTLRIYYTTNSCCYYCFSDKYEPHLLDFIGEELVVPSKKNCEGCSSTYALLFVAKNPGTDSLKGQIVAASSPCPDSTYHWETYVVHISEK